MEGANSREANSREANSNEADCESMNNQSTENDDTSSVSSSPSRESLGLPIDREEYVWSSVRKHNDLDLIDSKTIEKNKKGTKINQCLMNHPMSSGKHVWGMKIGM